VSKSDAFFAHVFLPTYDDSSREIIEFDYNKEKDAFISKEGDLCNFHPWSATDDFLTPQQETSKIEFLARLDKSINELQKDRLKKVVLSRVFHINRKMTNIEDIIYPLAQAYPQSLVYHTNHPRFGEWIGATPELLFARDGWQIDTMALAGTLPRESTSIWSDKLLNEHEYVANDIVNTFNALGAKMVTRVGPQERLVGPVKHLETKFTFQIGVTNEALIRSLHPTSAICGYPRETASQWIAQNESHQRRMYCGLIEIQNKACSSFYVNLRCAQVFHQHLELYAGVGLTRYSHSHEEWRETERKLETIGQLFT